MAYELKTKITDESVTAFLNKIEDEKRRHDCFALLDLMTEISGFEPKMWGTSIVGFGSYHYKYASGHEGEMCVIGFSPRKANITLYLSAYFIQNVSVTENLGKFKTGKGCLNINKMEDINVPVLKEVIKKTLVHLKRLYNS